MSINGSTVQGANDLLICFSHTPYGSGHSSAGLDAALAASALGLRVTLLFVGAGVLNLVAQQQGAAIGRKTLGKVLQALPFYDIDELFVDAAAIQRFAVTLEPQLPIVLLDEDAVARLLHSDTRCLSY